MIYYVSGQENSDRFELVIKLTSIRSSELIDAMRQHLVDGRDESLAAVGLVDLSNLKRGLRRYNETLSLIERVKEIDWGKGG